MKFSSVLGWKGPSKEGVDPVKSAIGWLENGGCISEGGAFSESGALGWMIGDAEEAKRKFLGFRVNYDQSTGAAASELLNMSTRNHHLKSIGHWLTPSQASWEEPFQYQLDLHSMRTTQTTGFKGGEIPLKMDSSGQKR